MTETTTACSAVQRIVATPSVLDDADALVELCGELMAVTATQIARIENVPFADALDSLVKADHTIAEAAPRLNPVDVERSASVCLDAAYRVAHVDPSTQLLWINMVMRRAIIAGF
jgi:hypothetical protein